MDHTANVESVAKWLHDQYAAPGPAWDADFPLAEHMRENWRAAARSVIAVMEGGYA